jgi:arginine N-succinyltransferase
MLLVRPGRLSDLDPLERMARTARSVLHSLPDDREALRERLALSEDAFRTQVAVPGEEIYLFVLEDTSRGAVLGTATIVAAAGYAEPFYAFRNDALIHASRELHVSRKIHALTMSHELTGRSRLVGFHIDPALLGDPVAHLLSRARMMYAAAHRQRFSSGVFSLLLGVTDDAGASPFWEAVGRKFFQRDFADVERVSGGRSRTFIAEVMPVYPLYVPLLPQAAQRVLGAPGPNALRTYEIHLEEGFEPDRYVDIFDAGPVLTVQVDACACATRAQQREVTDFDGSVATRHAPLQVRHAPHMISTDASGEFRCVLADLPVDPAAGAPFDARTREVLGAALGGQVRCVPLRREGEHA